ncbi:MAG TPA: hypothetical protein VJ948_05370 [Acidimicrobiia bacterium]|nr:hypothetical protein [Acidimicrobiia bacterium]
MIVLIASVVIGGVFGAATATVESNDGEVMVLEIEVELDGTPTAVVAHLAFDDEPELTVPLLDRGNGEFGITTELEPKNYVVVFESIGDEGETSDPVTLSQMGADLGPEPGESGQESEDEGLSIESSRLLWLAVALGAASLSVLAFWVLGGRDERVEVVVVEDDEQ